VSKILIPKGLIVDRIQKLAEWIAQDTQGPVKACCILKGAHVFYASLMDHLKHLKNGEGASIPLSFEFIKVKSYMNDSSVGNIQISLLESDLIAFEGKEVLIVEDIVDTGATMVALIDLIKKYNPKSIRVVSLLLKKTIRSNNYV
jgi:hypoxanthine phosphoribosyltransferase